MSRYLAWARVRRPNGIDLTGDQKYLIQRLRRGAWYPVVYDNAFTLVFLEVGDRKVPVPRQLLQLSRARPKEFSLVVRSPDDPHPVREAPSDLGLTYAVCPSSGCRVRIAGHPEVLRCPDCGRQYPVAWYDPS